MTNDMQASVEWLFGLSRFTNVSGLGCIRELLSRLGDPQDSFRSIHVAGSDGKGSTCALIESILRCSGIRTGLYTSPHIVRPNERIRVCGRQISDSEFVSLVEHIRPIVEGMISEGYECSFFEAVTAMAFAHFKDVGVEYAVVEVGLGGRFDATNVIVPDVSVITNISLEHTQILGDTIEKIAGEKAGIIKDGVPVVTSNGGPALEVIMGAAERHGSVLTAVSGADVERYGEDGDSVRYRDMVWHIGIPGSFQAVNAAMAYEAVAQSGVWDRVRGHVARGMEEARWPARMQRIDGLPLIVDVTHTAAGMECLCRDVLRIYGHTVTVFGVLDDKDIAKMSEHVAAMSEKVIVITPDSPRALSSDITAGYVSRHSEDVSRAASFDEAMDLAMAESDGRMILVTGSFAMAESAFRWLERRGHVRASDI